MTELKFGDQHDKSKAQFHITTASSSATKVEVGSQYDQSTREVTIRDSSTGTTQRPAISAAAKEQLPNPNQIWTSGSFFLIALLISAVTFAALAKKLEWYAVPAVIVAALLAVYLLALILMPKSGLSEKGFQKLMLKFMSVALGGHERSPSKSPPKSPE
jgi:hypothetical protein